MDSRFSVARFIGHRGNDILNSYNFRLIFQAGYATFPSMITGDILADSQKYIMNTYGRQPLVLVKGEGCRVWDDAGKEYLDNVSTESAFVNFQLFSHTRLLLFSQRWIEALGSAYPDQMVSWYALTRRAKFWPNSKQACSSSMEGR